MLEDLSSKDKVVGLKQVRRAIVCGRAGHVFLARDARPAAYGAAGGLLPGGWGSRFRGVHHGPAGPCLRHRRTHGRSGAAGKGKTASNGIKFSVPWKI